MPALRLAEHARVMFWVWVSLWSVVLLWGVLIVRKFARLASREHLQQKSDDIALFLQFVLWISLSLILLLKW
jgi:H+/Cl- antiporter ClcA